MSRLTEEQKKEHARIIRELHKLKYRYELTWKEFEAITGVDRYSVHNVSRHWPTTKTFQKIKISYEIIKSLEGAMSLLALKKENERLTRQIRSDKQKLQRLQNRIHRMSQKEFRTKYLISIDDAELVAIPSETERYAKMSATRRMIEAGGLTVKIYDAENTETPILVRTAEGWKTTTEKEKEQ